MKLIKITELTPKGVDVPNRFITALQPLNELFELDYNDLKQFNQASLFDLLNKYPQPEFELFLICFPSLLKATITIEYVCDVCGDISNNDGECQLCQIYADDSRAITELHEILNKDRY